MNKKNITFIIIAIFILLSIMLAKEVNATTDMSQVDVNINFYVAKVKYIKNTNSNPYKIMANKEYIYVPFALQKTGNTTLEKLDINVSSKKGEMFNEFYYKSNSSIEKIEATGKASGSIYILIKDIKTEKFIAIEFTLIGNEWKQTGLYRANLDLEKEKFELEMQIINNNIQYGSAELGILKRRGFNIFRHKRKGRYKYRRKNIIYYKNRK